MNNSYLNGYMIGYLEKEAGGEYRTKPNNDDTIQTAHTAPPTPAVPEPKIDQAAAKASVKAANPPEPKIDQAAAKASVKAANPPKLVPGFQKDWEFIKKNPQYSK